VTSLELKGYLEKTFKNSVRIVGENASGHFSTIWSFLGRTDGFYFGPRSVISSLKISLHANNHRGYVGFDRNYFRRKQAEGRLQLPTKTMFEWELPRPNAGEAIQIASLIVPSQFMACEAHPYVSQKKVIVFGVESNCALQVLIFLSNRGEEIPERLFLEIGQPVFETKIDNWFKVSVVARSVTFDPSILPSMDQISRSRFHQLLSAEALASQSSPSNMLLWNEPKDRAALEIIDVGGIAVMRNS
jgi:hypothetical protein